MPTTPPNPQCADQELCLIPDPGYRCPGSRLSAHCCHTLRKMARSAIAKWGRRVTDDQLQDVLAYVVFSVPASLLDDALANQDWQYLRRVVWHAIDWTRNAAPQGHPDLYAWQEDALNRGAIDHDPAALDVASWFDGQSSSSSSAPCWADILDACRDEMDRAIVAQLMEGWRPSAIAHQLGLHASNVGRRIARIRDAIA